MHDHMGHLIGLLHMDGSVHETYRYSAYGEEQLFDAQGQELETSHNPWRYASKRKDQETGFIYFGLRFYDPATCRWVTPDPVGQEGGPNLYTYVMNNPLAYFDLLGLTPEMDAYHDFEIDRISNYIREKESRIFEPDQLSKGNWETIRSGGSYLASAAWNIYSHPRVQGALQAIGGMGEMGVGAWMASGSGGLAMSAGMGLAVHGADQFTAGMRTALTGRHTDSLTVQGLQQVGVSHNIASCGSDLVTIGATMGGAAIAREAYQVATISANANASYRGAKISNSIEFQPINNSCSSDYVNLANKSRTQHILFGDGTGGEHLYPGVKGKSPFPKEWDGNKIMHIISDLATDPNIRWKQLSGKIGARTTKRGLLVRYEAVGVREGLKIKTIIEPYGQGIITGFPIYE